MISTFFIKAAFFNSLLLHAHIHIMHEHFYFNPHNLLKAVVVKIQIGCSTWVGHQCLNVWESTIKSERGELGPVTTKKPSCLFGQMIALRLMYRYSLPIWLV